MDYCNLYMYMIAVRIQNIKYIVTKKSEKYEVFLLRQMQKQTIHKKLMKSINYKVFKNLKTVESAGYIT